MLNSNGTPSTFFAKLITSMIVVSRLEDAIHFTKLVTHFVILKFILTTNSNFNSSYTVSLPHYGLLQSSVSGPAHVLSRSHWYMEEHSNTSLEIYSH